MNKLEKLYRTEWPVVHRYMKQTGFPDVPNDYEQAVPYLEKTRNFGVYDDNGRVIAALIVGEMQENSAYLDVVCSPVVRGRWLSKNVIKQIYHLLFQDMRLKFVWCEPKRSVSLKVALSVGFVWVSGAINLPVLVLTKRNLEEKLKI